MMSRTEIADRIDKLLFAYYICNDGPYCHDGCPYYGRCSTKIFAIESDVCDILCDILGVLNDGKHAELCSNIRGTYLAVCQWMIDMRCGHTINGDGVLCLQDEMDKKIIAMLKQLKSVVAETK